MLVGLALKLSKIKKKRLSNKYISTKTREMFLIKLNELVGL